MNIHKSQLWLGVSLGTRVLTHPRISTQILNILKCLHSTHLLGCFESNTGSKDLFHDLHGSGFDEKYTFWPQSSSIKKQRSPSGGFNPSEKMMEFVNGVGMDIPYMKWKIIQSCLKPPTSHGFSKSFSVERLLLSHGVLSFQTRNTRRAGEFWTEEPVFLCTDSSTEFGCLVFDHVNAPVGHVDESNIYIYIDGLPIKNCDFPWLC